VIFPDAWVMAEGHEDRERSDANRRQELDANLMWLRAIVPMQGSFCGECGGKM